MNLQRDHLWKIALRLMMQQIVEFFFPDKYDEVDWTKEIVFLDKELNAIQVDSRPKNRIADALAMLTLKSGNPLYVFLHIEVQGYPDADYELRIHQMDYRIEDKMGAKPVMLSILTDDDPNFHPKEYYVEAWGSSTRTIFNSYKVMDHPPSTYKNPNNPVAMLMEIIYTSTQITKATDREIMKLFVGLVKKLISRGYSKQYIYLMKCFIEAHVKFANSDKYRTFEQKIKEMVTYETTEEILSFLDFEKRLEVAEKEQKKTLLELAQFQQKAILARQKEIAAIKEKEAAIKEKEAAIKESRKETRKEKEAARKKEEAARKKEEAARKKEEQTRILGVLGMLSQGMQKELIATIFKITIKEVIAIQKKYKDNNPIAKLLNGHSEN